MRGWAKILAGVIVLVLIWIVLYWEIWAKSYVAMPSDLLVGAYYPWLNFKWGYEVGVPVKNPEISDVFSQVFVWKQIIRESILSGQWPLWNRYDMSGSPLLASFQPAVFFPTTLLTTFLSVAWGWNWHIMLSTLVAMFGMFFYLKNWNLSIWAQILGSVLFATGSLMTTWTEIGTTVWAMSMLVWCLVWLDLFFLDKKRKWFGLFSIFVMLLIFAGHVQMMVYGLVVILFYSLVRVWFEENYNLKQKYRLFVLIVIYILIGIGLASIQLFPTIELYYKSIRGLDYYTESVNYGLILWPQLIKVWIGDFYGNPITGNYSHNQSYHETSLFLGVLALPLILPLFLYSKNLVNKTKILIKLWGLIGLISVLLVINNPISRFIYQLDLPLITSSYASRLWFIANMTSAVLTGIGFNQFIKSEEYRSKSKWIALGLIFVCLIIYLIISWNWEVKDFRVAFKNGIVPLGILTGYVFLLIFKFLPKNLVVVYVLILTVITQGMYFRKYNPFTDSKLLFPTTQTIDFLSNQKDLFRIARISNNVLPPNTWGYYGIESVEGYNPLHLLSYSRYFRLMDNGKWGTSVSRYLEMEQVNPKYLSAMNVKYVLVLANNQIGIDKLLKDNFREVLRENNVYVYENPNVMNRAYYVNEVMKVDKSQIAKILSTESFNPLTTAITSDNLDNISDKNALEFDSNATLEISKYEANKVNIKSESSKDEFMVLADSYDDGWKVNIDGVKSKSNLVNGAIRGVFVPKGKHEIIYEYWPNSFRWGIGVSLFFVLLLGLTEIIRPRNF